MHQFKINGKMAFEGDVWQWHQDYGTWLNDDMMPTERAMNVAIFLDDVNEHNGPLMFIPGSHKKGVVDAKHDLTTTSYPLWTVDNDLIEQLVERAGGKNGGIVSPKGPAGSMILFHSCLVHASGSNLSPWHRVAVYLSLCAVSNHIRRPSGPSTSPTATSHPSNACPTTACSKTIRWTCPGKTACPPAPCKPRPCPLMK
jgi:ectoine hydroxylase